MKKYILGFSFMIGINAYSQKADYEVFATVEQSVGNIAFTHQGDLVYSHHPFFNPKFLMKAMAGGAFSYRFTTAIFRMSFSVSETKFPFSIFG